MHPEITIHPNPVVNNVSIRITQKAKGMMNIKIRDITGRIIVTKQIQVNAGINILKINNLKQSGFTNGTYLVQVSRDNESKLFKMIMQ